MRFRCRDLQVGDEIVLDCGWPDIAGLQRATVTKLDPYDNGSELIRVRIHVDGSSRTSEPLFVFEKVNILVLLAEASQ